MNYDLAGGSMEVRGVPLQRSGADGSIYAGGCEYLLLDELSAGDDLVLRVESSDLQAGIYGRLIRID